MHSIFYELTFGEVGGGESTGILGVNFSMWGERTDLGDSHLIPPVGNSANGHSKHCKRRYQYKTLIQFIPVLRY